MLVSQDKKRHNAPYLNGALLLDVTLKHGGGVAAQGLIGKEVIKGVLAGPQVLVSQRKDVSDHLQLQSSLKRKNTPKPTERVRR